MVSISSALSHMSDLAHLSNSDMTSLVPSLKPRDYSGFDFKVQGRRVKSLSRSNTLSVCIVHSHSGTICYLKITFTVVTDVHPSASEYSWDEYS